MPRAVYRKGVNTVQIFNFGDDISVLYQETTQKNYWLQQWKEKCTETQESDFHVVSTGIYVTLA